MNKRKEEILKSIISDYIDRKAPVSSSALQKKNDFDLSSATLRNEMLDLEREGMLEQPHTSAGRIPSDKGYRYYIDNLMIDREIGGQEEYILKKKIVDYKNRYGETTKTITKILASETGSLAISTVVRKKEIYNCGISELLKEPEFEQVNDFCDVASLCDFIDDNIERVSEVTKGKEVQIYIGQENPIIEADNCSMVISNFKKGNEKGFIALVGPKRMKYDRNVSLINYLSKILSSGGFVFIFFVQNNL